MIRNISVVVIFLVVGCTNVKPSLDFKSNNLFEDEFVGKRRSDLVKQFGAPSNIWNGNIAHMNLVGRAQVLILKEKEILGLGGELTQVRFDYGTWRTYIWELKDGRIVASIRFDSSQVYMK